MLQLSTEPDHMEAHATERMVMGLVSRLEREGHHLTPAAVDRIHKIITDALPDTRMEGTQKELTAFVNERIQRDEP